jgi:hypothetical protein
MHQSYDEPPLSIAKFAEMMEKWPSSRAYHLFDELVRSTECVLTRMMLGFVVSGLRDREKELKLSERQQPPPCPPV